MRYQVTTPVYSTIAKDYRPAEFAVPRFEQLLASAVDSRATKRSIRAVLEQLGFDGESHISSHAAGTPARDVLTPLARSGTGRSHPVERVRSYGRGYVQPDISLRWRGHTVTGSLAVKGSGVEAWAADNQAWIRRENRGRGVVLGYVPSRHAVDDLLGESAARGAGLIGPMTVYCAQRPRGIQFGRLWQCPYRLWELSSGPFRTGPYISQTFVHLNWGVELAFARKYRNLVTPRAVLCLETASGTGAADGWREVERRVLRNLVRVANAELQLAPYAFHLANISYSGETSGFDRIRGRATAGASFSLGVVTALIESWAAVSWLAAALGQRPRRFHRFFRRFQEELAGSHAPRATLSAFASARDIADVLSRDRGHGADMSRDRHFFSVRSGGDVETFLTACETFLDGLWRSYTGEFRTARQQEAWQRRTRFATCEEIRIWQSKGGAFLAAPFVRLVREHRVVEAKYRRLFDR